jgi:hypothetical protein
MPLKQLCSIWLPELWIVSRVIIGSGNIGQLEQIHLRVHASIPMTQPKPSFR